MMMPWYGVGVNPLQAPIEEAPTMVLTISLLLAAACIVPAAAKLLGHSKMRASAAHFGIPWSRYRLIGLAELAAAVGVLAGVVGRPLGIAAATGMAVLLAGALVAHRRAGDRPQEATPAFATLGLTAVYLAVAVAL
jgi:DoxX-like family